MHTYQRHWPFSPVSREEDRSSTIAEWEVTPVYAEDYPFLGSISDPENRYEVFMQPGKLTWAKTLKCGDRAFARLWTKPPSQPLNEEYTPVHILSVGQTKIGFKFGVRSSVSAE